MAIEVVNTDNLAEYAARRAELRNPSAMVASAVPATAETPAVIAAEEAAAVVTGGEEIKAPDPGEQEPTAAKKRKDNPIQPRIDELVRARKEADEFAEGEYEARLQAQRRVSELEQQVKELTEAKPKPVSEPELIAPDPSKYTDQALYNKDFEAYQEKLIDKRVTTRLEAERAAERQQAQDALLTERVALARKDIPDFDEVIEAKQKSRVSVPSHIVAAITESEYGPQLAYSLAKDSALEKRIYGFSPAKALLELGRLELDYKPKAEAKAEAEAPQKPVNTRAPAPIKSLRGEGGSVQSDLSQPMPFKEYKRLKLQERKA